MKNKKRKNIFTMGLLFGILLIFLIEVVSAACPSGMVSYWNFDDASGNTASDSVGDNDGTLRNDPVWTTGQVNGTLDFDGVNDYVDVGDVLDMGTQSFSVGVWIKSEGFQGSNVYGGKIINKGLTNDGTPPNAGYGLRLWPNNKLEVMLIDSANTFFKYNSPTTLNNNQWYYLVFTVDKTNSISKLFIDGREDTSKDITGMISLDTNIPLVVGALHRGIYHGPVWRTTEFFNGLIDEVAIYNRALTPQEIKEHYDNGLNGIGYCYQDMGLRVFDGTQTVSIAAEPWGTLTSPLRIFKNGNIYGIALVEPGHPNDSGVRIWTSSGIKALKKI